MRETVRYGVFGEGTIRKGVVSVVRKLIAILAAALALTYAQASAAEVIPAYGGDGCYEITQPNGTDGRVIISDYDDGGRLIGCGMYTAQNGVFTVPSDKLGNLSRAWFLGTDEVMEIKLVPASQTPQPTVTPTETPTPEPDVKPTSTPDRSYPAVYGKEINAVNAFSVVKDVVETTVDGEDYFEADLLFQGEETKALIPTDLLIGASSEEFSYMDGKNAGALREGDVIFTRKSLTGKYAVLSLIYRPLDEDIVTSDADYGKSFEKLISSDGKVAGFDWSVMKYGSDGGSGTSYAFGIVYERNPGEIVLIGPGGDTNAALYIPAQNDTIVYEYDMSVRKNPLTVSKLSALRGISGAKPGDDGIIDYSDASKYTYALVRTVDGDAMDIAAFTNYR